MDSHALGDGDVLTGSAVALTRVTALSSGPNTRTPSGSAVCTFQRPPLISKSRSTGRRDPRRTRSSLNHARHLAGFLAPALKGDGHTRRRRHVRSIFDCRKHPVVELTAPATALGKPIPAWHQNSRKWSRLFTDFYSRGLEGPAPGRSSRNSSQGTSNSRKPSSTT